MRGHIKSRSPGSWSIVTTVAGKQKWTTIHGTRRDAERELTRLQRASDQGVYIEPSRITLEQYLANFLEHAAQSRQRHTIETLEGIYRVRINPALGSTPLAKVTSFAIQSLYTELGKRLSPRSMHHTHRALSLALKQAVKWDMLAVNPCAKVEAPKAGRSKMRVLDAAQLGTLLQQVKGSELEVPVTLAATCGLRRGEVLGLKWGDVNFEAGTINVVRSLEESARGGLHLKSTKSGKPRTVKLMKATIETLRRHKAEHARTRLAGGMGADPENLVCPGMKGGYWRPSTFGKRFALMMKRSSLPCVKFHELRHSHATLGLASNVPAKVMSEMLGHANISITMDTYSHVLPGMQEAAVTLMEQALEAGK